MEETPLTPLTQLAISYYNLRRYIDCVRICQFMLNHELDEEPVYYYEAKALSKLKDFKKSNDLLRICLAKAISKTAELYYYDLGGNYEALKEYKEAVMQYDTAYYLFKNPLMNYNCGGIYETNLKNERLARRYYAIYLKEERPKSPEEKQAYLYVKRKWGVQKTNSKKNRFTQNEPESFCIYIFLYC